MDHNAVYARGQVPAALSRLTPAGIAARLQGPLNRRGVVLVTGAARYTSPHAYHLPMEVAQGDLSGHPHLHEWISNPHGGRSSNLIININGKGRVTYVATGGVQYDFRVRDVCYEVFGRPLT